MEQITPKSWITIGPAGSINAVVCTIRPKRIEVVYLNEQGKALHCEVQWARGHWDFADAKNPGKPADKDPRLTDYVKILRSQA